MASQRQEKMKKELIKVGNEFLNEISNRSSLITITKADISPDLKNAKLYVTIMPDDKEHEALDFIQRRSRDLFPILKKHIAGKIIPRIQFSIDEGEKHRQRIDQLLRNA